MSRKTILAGILLLIAYSLALNLPYLSKREFQGEAARRAVAALEMMERHHYLIPYIEGRPYLWKPPLYNWVLVGFFKLTGSHSEFTARLSSVLAATLAALFLAFVFREVARPKGLLWVLPGLVFLSTPEVLDKACRAEIDMTYTFLVTLAVFSWFYFHEIKARPLLAWTFALGVTALATLTKTFQALAFLYSAIVPYLFWTRRGKLIISPAHLLGLAIYALILGLWFIPASREVGAAPILRAWFSEYFSKKNALTPSGFWGHFFGFPWEYLKGHLPWILFLLTWKEKDFRVSLSQAEKKLLLYSLCLLALSFPIYWLSPGSRLRYMLPAVGGLIFLVSFPIKYLWERPWPSGLLWSLRVLLVSMALSGPALLFFGWQRLHISENLWSVVFVLGLTICSLLWLKISSPSLRIIWLFLVLLAAKLSFAGLYFPYQDRYRDHYRRAARLLMEYLPPQPVLLCDFGVNTPHITYYLHYRFRPEVKVIRVNSAKDLTSCDFVLVQRKNKEKLKGFETIIDFKARRTPLSLLRPKTNER